MEVTSLKCFKCRKDITEDLNFGQIEVTFETSGQQLYKVKQGTLRVFCSRECKEKWIQEQT